MIIINNDNTSHAPSSPSSSTSSNNTSNSSKKLKQSTINFFTKDIDKDKQQTSPPAKKPKLVVETKEVVIDITEDEAKKVEDNDNSINEEDNSAKLHPLSGLVGTALKRKLRKKKTVANVEKFSETASQESEQSKTEDVIEVLDESVQQKDEEAQIKDVSTKTVEKTSKKPTPKRTRKTPSRSSARKTAEEKIPEVTVVEMETEGITLNQSIEKVKEETKKVDLKRTRQTPSRADSKKPQKTTPKRLNKESTTQTKNKQSAPDDIVEVLDESVPQKDEEIKTEDNSSKNVEKSSTEITPKRTRKVPSIFNSKKIEKPPPKEPKVESSKPVEEKPSETVIEIQDDESSEGVLEKPVENLSEPVVKLILDNCEDVEMADVNEAGNKKESTSEKSSNSENEENIEETRVELKTPKSTKLTASPRAASERRLTPKQLQKKLESEKKKQEKEKEKLEREKKRQEEKDERQKLKLEKEEQRKKEKEDKEELKRKEKEEKEKQKELERKEREEREELKRKEKEEKELMKKKEKEAKEEDRKRKELEKEEERKRKGIEKEEAEQKQKKAAALFVNFFVPKAGSSKCSNDSEKDDSLSKNGLLSMFRIKSDMRLAPTVRHHLTEEQKSKLDEILKQEIVDKTLYLKSLKNADYCIKTSSKTWPFSEAKDCIVVEDDLPPVDDMNVEMDISQKQVLRAKLFSFSENRRPPYWGTWRKKSKHINGRRPFGLDKTFLDYECDSDDEWEEEEPGESVGSVAGSDDEGSDNEYDVDNEFMVPHGYLSEEEALGDDDHISVSPETQKLKLKLLEDEFENERKKTTERLHPRLLGIIWQTEDSGKPDSCSDPVWNFLGKRKILTVEETILVQPISENTLDNDDDCADRPESEVKSKRLKLSEAMMPDLIKLVHGNTNNKGFLCKEFSTYINKTQNINVLDSKENEQPPTPVKSLSKLAIVKKIKEISKWMPCPDEGTMQSKMCWFVEKGIREKYGLEDLAVPNTWDYILLPKNDRRKTKANLNTSATEESKPVTKEPVSGKKENGFQITKFTKILSREERDKQFASPKPSTCEEEKPASAKQNPEPKEKKRVSLLFSGPRGVSLPSSKNNETEKEKEKNKDVAVSEPNEQNMVKGARSNLLSQFIKVDKKRKIDEVLDEESGKDKDCVVLSD